MPSRESARSIPAMDTDLDKIRHQLTVLRHDLQTLKGASAGNLRPIELDQQSVGRLSRMDSLQMQAMDQARDARRAMDLRRIEAALGRLDDGEYGYCVKCGDEIGVRRLKLDPATPQCTSCAQ